MIIILITTAVVVSLYFIFEWSCFIPAKGNVAILMYHKVTPSQNDSLSITVDYLRKQFDYIRNGGFEVISFQRLMEIDSFGDKASEKYILLTFDDGYKNNKDLLLPLLGEYGFPATIFLTAAYIGGENEWDGGGEALLSFDDLREMARLPNIEFGLHSYEHKAYSDLSPNDVKRDVEKCKTILQKNEIPFIPVLAYPYGAYPKRDSIKREQMFEVMKKTGIKYALRIGNGLNRLPFKKPYELKRINIRGSDSFITFKTKLKKGHRKLFE